MDADLAEAEQWVSQAVELLDGEGDGALQAGLKQLQQQRRRQGETADEDEEDAGGPPTRDPKLLLRLMQAMRDRFMQMASSGREMLEQPAAAAAAAEVLRLVPADVRSMVASAVVSSDLIAALAAVLELYAGYEGDMHALDAAHHSHELLAVVLQCTQDVCEGAFKRGQGPTISCRDLCGQAMLEPLLQLGVKLSDLPDPSSKRAWADTLLSLLTKSRANAELIVGSLKPQLVQVFAHLLPGCGDFNTQSELVEVLYRLGRNSQLEAACEVLGAAIPPAVQAGGAAASAAVKKLRELVGKSTQGLDLTKELRGVVMAFNAQLGAHATVKSFKADAIQLSLPLVAAPDCWVDVGAGRMLTINVVPKQGDEEPDEEEPSEPLDIPFSALTNILLNDAGMDDTRVRLELRVAGVAQHGDRPFDVHISLVVAMARQLLRSLPDLDRQRLLQNQSQSHEGLWLELSQGGGARGQAGGSAAKPQPKVLRQKMSMGLTTYKPLVLQPAKAPQPMQAGRPPLPFQAGSRMQHLAPAPTTTPPGATPQASAQAWRSAERTRSAPMPTPAPATSRQAGATVERRASDPPRLPSEAPSSEARGGVAGADAAASKPLPARPTSAAAAVSAGGSQRRAARTGSASALRRPDTEHEVEGGIRERVDGMEVRDVARQGSGFARQGSAREGVRVGGAEAAAEAGERAAEGHPDLRAPEEVEEDEEREAMEVEGAMEVAGAMEAGLAGAGAAGGMGPGAGVGRGDEGVDGMGGRLPSTQYSGGSGSKADLRASVGEEEEEEGEGKGRQAEVAKGRKQRGTGGAKAAGAKGGKAAKEAAKEAAGDEEEEEEEGRVGKQAAGKGRVAVKGASANAVGKGAPAKGQGGKKGAAAVQERGKGKAAGKRASREEESSDEQEEEEEEEGREEEEGGKVRKPPAKVARGTAPQPHVAPTARGKAGAGAAAGAGKPPVGAGAAAGAGRPPVGAGAGAKGRKATSGQGVVKAQPRSAASGGAGASGGGGVGASAGGGVKGDTPTGKGRGAKEVVERRVSPRRAGSKAAGVGVGAGAGRKGVEKKGAGGKGKGAAAKGRGKKQEEEEEEEEEGEEQEEEEGQGVSIGQGKGGEGEEQPDSQPEWLRSPAPAAAPVTLNRRGLTTSLTGTGAGAGPGAGVGVGGSPVSGKTFRSRKEQEREEQEKGERAEREKREREAREKEERERVQRPPRAVSPFDFGAGESEEEGPTITGDRQAAAVTAAAAGPSSKPQRKTAAGGGAAARGKGGRGGRGGRGGARAQQEEGGGGGGGRKGAATAAAGGAGGGRGAKRKAPPGAAVSDPIEDSEPQDLDLGVTGGPAAKRQRHSGGAAAEAGKPPVGAAAAAGAKGARKEAQPARAVAGSPKRVSPRRANGGAGAATSGGRGSLGSRPDLRASPGPSPGKGRSAGGGRRPGARAAAGAGAARGAGRGRAVTPPPVSKELSGLQQEWSEILQEQLVVEEADDAPLGRRGALARRAEEGREAGSGGALLRGASFGGEEAGVQVVPAPDFGDVDFGAGAEGWGKEEEEEEEREREREVPGPEPADADLAAAAGGAGFPYHGLAASPPKPSRLQAMATGLAAAVTVRENGGDGAGAGAGAAADGMGTAVRKARPTPAAAAAVEVEEAEGGAAAAGAGAKPTTKPTGKYGAKPTTKPPVGGARKELGDSAYRLQGLPKAAAGKLQAPAAAGAGAGAAEGAGGLLRPLLGVGEPGVGGVEGVGGRRVVTASAALHYDVAWRAGVEVPAEAAAAGGLAVLQGLGQGISPAPDLLPQVLHFDGSSARPPSRPRTLPGQAGAEMEAGAEAGEQEVLGAAEGMGEGMGEGQGAAVGRLGLGLRLPGLDGMGGATGSARGRAGAGVGAAAGGRPGAGAGAGAGLGLARAPSGGVSRLSLRGLEDRPGVGTGVGAGVGAGPRQAGSAVGPGLGLTLPRGPTGDRAGAGGAAHAVPGSPTGPTLSLLQPLNLSLARPPLAGKAAGGRGKAGPGAAARAGKGIGGVGGVGGVDFDSSPPELPPTLGLGGGSPTDVMQAVAAMLMGQDEEGEADEEESEQLQLLVQQLMEVRKSKMNKRKQALIQDMLARMEEGARLLEGQLIKSRQAAKDAQRRKVEQQERALQEKQAEIQSFITRFVEQLRSMWGEYEHEFGKCQLVKEELEAAARSQTQFERQRVQQYGDEVSAEVSRLEERLRRLDAKKPDLSLLARLGRE